MITRSAAANYDFKRSAGIVLNSRTVVEKDGFVSTGLLSYAEGDILEIEIAQYKNFNLGDGLKITVYSPGGVYTFQSTVVAKHQGSLMIINPPQNQSRFVEKRESPRVQVNEKGILLALTRTHADDKEELPEAVGLTLLNISSSGIGFTISADELIAENELDLCNGSMIEAEFDLGFKLPVVAEIIRRENVMDGFYYGARYVDMDSEKVTSIRAFVLKKQVESYFKEKEVELLKRQFE